MMIDETHQLTKGRNWAVCDVCLSVVVIGGVDRE